MPNLKSDLVTTVPPGMIIDYPVDQQPLAFVVEGPRNARTDDDGLRFYNWKGIEYPSVTTIRRIAGLPFGLHQWALTQVIKRATGEWPDNMAPDDPETAKWLRRAATEARDLAADRGKRLHFAVESGVEPDADIKALAMQQEAFLDATDAEVLASEVQVWSPTYGYAGTLDAIADISVRGVRVRAILDWKTGKSVYPEHALQLAAYAGADFVGADDTLDQKATTLLASVQRLGVVHLSDTGWDLIDFDPTPQLWEAWLGLLNFATFLHRHPDITMLARPEYSLSSGTGLTITAPSEPVARNAMHANPFRSEETP